MDRNNLPNWNMPDFSHLTELVRVVQESMRPIVETAQRVQEVLRPIVEIAAQYREKIASTINTVAKAAMVFVTIEAMGDSQFVYWKVMDKSFVEALVETQNVNKTLREALVKEKFTSTYTTIGESQNHPLMKKHLRLYTQAVAAFQSGHNDLAVNGFVSVFDGLLSAVSGKATHRLAPRIQEIEKKLEKEEVLENDEYATLTLAITFQKTMESFSQSVPFDQKEPKGLNRHWIAHGRSTRRKTKLDVVKMINLIYGLLLIHDLDANAAPKAD